MATTKPVGAYFVAPPVVAAPYGLINSVTLVPDTERWEGGISFESMLCSAVVDLWDACEPDPTNIVDGTGSPRIVYAPPVGITATDTCTSTFGATAREQAAERALQLLEASTQKALEKELMWGYVASGTTPNGRWLTGPDTEVIGSAAVSPRSAVAMLEDAYAAAGLGDAGVLHLTRGTATGHGRIAPDEDGVLRTKLDTLVIAGSGYAPDPDAPAEWQGTWAFITGPTFVWLGEAKTFPEDPSQAIDVAKNDMRYKAERLGAVTFDGCRAFAVKVDIANL